VFAPLGIENASLVWNEKMARFSATGHGRHSPLGKGKPSQPNVAASLHVSAQNYARFLIAIVEGQGLSAGTAKEMRLMSHQVSPTSFPGTWTASGGGFAVLSRAKGL
jgi:hypothetical protein